MTTAGVSLIKVREHVKDRQQRKFALHFWGEGQFSKVSVIRTVDIELMKHRISNYGTILLLRPRNFSRVHRRSFLTAFDQDPVKINIRRTLPYILDPA